MQKFQDKGVYLTLRCICNHKHEHGFKLSKLHFMCILERYIFSCQQEDQYSAGQIVQPSFSLSSDSSLGSRTSFNFIHCRKDEEVNHVSIMDMWKGKALLCVLK